MKVRAKEAAPTRKAVFSEVAKRYATRIHMTLIIAGSISMGALTTATLMRLGVETLWLRWLPALASAYLAFFAGVWLWLRLSAYGRYLNDTPGGNRQSLAEGAIDTLDLGSNIPLPRGGASVVREVLRAGGGTFDGGGASAQWAGEAVSKVASAPSGLAEGLGNVAGDAVSKVASSPSGLAEGLGNVAGDAVGEVAGDDGGIVLVIALALLAVLLALLFGAAGFVIWQAPSILGEVVFEAMLGSSFVKGAKAVQAGSWAGALFTSTWKPFGLVAVFAMAFAGFAGAVAPQARTAAEVIATLSTKAAD